MWITLIVTILSYLMSSRDTSSQRRSALLKAAAAGAVTYGVTNYTDWGQENLAPLDATIDGWLDPTPDANQSQTGAGGTQDNLWTTLKAWGPKGVTQALVGAGVGTSLVTGSISSWLPWVAGAAALILLAK